MSKDVIDRPPEYWMRKAKLWFVLHGEYEKAEDELRWFCKFKCPMRLEKEIGDLYCSINTWSLLTSNAPHFTEWKLGIGHGRICIEWAKHV
jgi:hypothetical protein